MNELLSGSFGFVVILFLFVLAILWFLLPFAIFGTKDKLGELIAESKRTNEHLSALRTEVEEMKGNDGRITNLTSK